MKNLKAIKITVITTLVLINCGLFVYIGNRPAHYKGEIFKNEKVVPSSSKTSTSTRQTKESSSTSTNTTQESIPVQSGEPQQETTPEEVNQEGTPVEASGSNIDYRQYDTNSVFQWFGGTCLLVENGDSYYPHQVLAYYKGYFIVSNDDGSYQAYDGTDGISISALDYDSVEEVKELIDRCTD